VDVIGRGFLAGHLARLHRSHPDVLAVAAGVSCASSTSVDDFGREGRLVYDAIGRARASGQRLLFFSTGSSGMYGGGGTGREDDPVYPPTAYGRHKFGLESVIRSSGVRHLVVRLGHVVGPNQPPHQLLPSLVAQIRTGHVVLHRGAERDLVDVTDAVDLLDRLLGSGAEGDVVNLASGAPVRVSDLVTELEARLGRRARCTEVDGVQSRSLSVQRLAERLPSAGLPFPADYYRTVLDRHRIGVPTPTAP